jgi:outer membrane receptor protein involved in Fe transport
VTANWQSATSVLGMGGAAGDLQFSELATVNVHLFANLADRFGGSKAPRWLKGMRATVGISNLFDRRPEVRDEAGSTPLSYQPGYLDPLGRLVSFSLRKVF